MTDDEMRVKVAEACGWKRVSYTDTYEGGSGRIRWKRPDGTWAGSPHDPADIYHLPVYPSDLNACAEMVASLDTNGRAAYVDELYLITGGEAGEMFDYINATARQRCIAFLKVKGLYYETT